MKYSIPYTCFLKTFDEKQIKNIEDYNLVMALHDKGFTKGEIAKRTKVTSDKLHQWRNLAIKPIPIQILETAKKRGYFSVLHEALLQKIAYLVGFNLGDGNVSRNLCNTWFYGVNTDLEAMKPLFNDFSVTPVIYIYKVNNGKMAVHDHVFSRFLVSLGAIKGDKTKSSYSIPKWIITSGRASIIKKRFLQGFFDSELSSPQFDKTRNFAYKTLKLYAVKHFNFVDDGEQFLNRIRNILTEFKIFSSEVKLDRTYIRSRDNGEMQQMFFMIYSNYINLYNFINNLGFLHNSKRVMNSLNSLPQLRKAADAEREKILKYKSALKLSKKGLSAYKIAKKLDIKVYHVKNWIYFKRKPRLYDIYS